MIESVLFDLDGTLTDPGMGITNSVMYALEQLGIAVPPRQELYKFIGPPLVESFREFYGMNEEEAARATELFRVYFVRHGIRENELYPGVVPMLRRLGEAGKHLVLATSKPEEFAKTVMAQFGLDAYVRDIAGASMDRTRTKKGQVIAYALERFGVRAETAVMVGDRKHDVLGAAEHHLPTVGVTYGYGDREELEQAGAAAVADTPEELTEILLGGTL